MWKLSVFYYYVKTGTQQTGSKMFVTRILQTLFSIFFIASISVTLQAAPEKNAQQLYRKNCANCHGADGTGTAVLRQQMGLNVVDLSSTDTAIQLSGIDLIQLIETGRPESGMPGFSQTLSETEIDQLIVHLSSKIIPQFPDVVALREGQIIYRRHCSVCHGDRGQVAIWAKAGLDPSPADFSNSEKKKQLKRQRMLFSVENGRPETAMTSWLGRFTRPQIEKVVDYIRIAIMDIGKYDKELGFAAGKGAPNNDPFLSSKDFNGNKSQTTMDVAIDLPIEGVNKPDPFLNNPNYSSKVDPNVGDDNIFDPLKSEHDHNSHFTGNLNISLPGKLIGDKYNGKKLFEDNCVACHGKKGDGKGPRAFFIFPKPRNFHQPAVVNRFTRPHIFNQINKGIKGTVMPAWREVLTKQQVADISEYLFVELIHKNSVPKQASKIES